MKKTKKELMKKTKKNDEKKRIDEKK